ncbi:hypothetical protein F383_15635 [Gossypium arboreum]|uniref:Uncharacterized protein n=1 Tax=Gossypium arboreum TaxID=29729 RepID=A0A0B0PVR9_GOSAR|nr:hypothetical protein F383_15635 [Gossypium arboreum]
MNSLDMSDMILRLPLWSSSYIYCRLTTACMSLPIYHSYKLTVQLNRAYCSTQ